MAFHTRTDEAGTHASTDAPERPSWLASYREHVRACVRADDASLWGDALARYLGRTRLVERAAVARLPGIRGHK